MCIQLTDEFGESIVACYLSQLFSMISDKTISVYVQKVLCTYIYVDAISSVV